MTSLVVEPASRGLRGRLRVPGDKSISHRALLLAARAEGRSLLRGLSGGDDVRRTRRAVAAFGVPSEGHPPGPVTVEGGSRRLHEPDGVIDVGNSGTSIRLLSGFAAAVDGLTILQGDRSVSGRPMERVVFPLRSMGAHVDGREGGRWPPLVVRGGRLSGIDYRPPVASAQVKGAVLLAGLVAEGATSVTEAVPTRRHTEELLAAAGADVTVAGATVTVRPSALQPLDLDVPGDPSQAAFWVVAACLVPGSDLLLPGVYVGPGRAAFLDVLARMGADITLQRHDRGTPTADVRVRHRRLVATDIGGDEVPGLIDEIPVLGVAAALAEGTTTFTGAGELRYKETDRLATMASQLAAVGADVEPQGDGLVVRGRSALAGGCASSHGDHRVAMAMAVAGLAARSPVRIEGWEAVDTSYPGFQEDLHRCLS